jgi:hypothetical protein
VRRQFFLSFFRLTQIERRMFRSIEANVSCINLSVHQPLRGVTCEYMNSTSSPTRLQSIGGVRKLRELGNSSLDTPRPATSEDLGAGTLLPGAALPGTPVRVPHITKSRNKPPVQSTSMLVVPSAAHRHPASPVLVPSVPLM